MKLLADMVLFVHSIKLVYADVPRGAGPTLIRGDVHVELSFNVRVEDPGALLVVVGIEDGRVEVVRRQFARVGGESFLAAHRIRCEFVGGGKNETLLVPRVLRHVVEQFDGRPAAQRHRQPFAVVRAADAIDRLVALVNHHKVVYFA